MARELLNHEPELHAGIADFLSECGVNRAFGKSRDELALDVLDALLEYAKIQLPEAPAATLVFNGTSNTFGAAFDETEPASTSDLSEQLAVQSGDLVLKLATGLRVSFATARRALMARRFQYDKAHSDVYTALFLSDALKRDEEERFTADMRGLAIATFADEKQAIETVSTMASPHDHSALARLQSADGWTRRCPKLENMRADKQGTLKSYDYCKLNDTYGVRPGLMSRIQDESSTSVWCSGCTARLRLYTAAGLLTELQVRLALCIVWSTGTAVATRSHTGRVAAHTTPDLTLCRHDVSHSLSQVPSQPLETPETMDHHDHSSLSRRSVSQKTSRSASRSYVSSA